MVEQTKPPIQLESNKKQQLEKQIEEIKLINEQQSCELKKLKEEAIKMR